jgi:hypothetical protein
MAKVIFFIDGFNPYHALDRTESRAYPDAFRKYKWLNLWRFASLFVGPKDSLDRVLLFTALTWDPQKVARHKLLIRANENAGVSIVDGESNAKIRSADCAISSSRHSRKNRWM